MKRMKGSKGDFNMAMNGEFDREVTFVIEEHIGVIASYDTGWKKELNLVSWNGAAPKFDIRDWDPEHKHMSRGITLHEKEMRLLMEMFRRRRYHHFHRKNDGAGSPSQVPAKDADRAETMMQDAIGEAAEVMTAIAKQQEDEPEEDRLEEAV